VCFRTYSCRALSSDRLGSWLSSYLLGSVRVIGVVGGMTLVVFGALQVNQARKPVRSDERSGSRWDQRSGVIVGLVFTGINPS